MNKNTGDEIVGYNEETGELVSNKSIYKMCLNKEKLENIKFIALVSKELNYKFQHAYNEYKLSISKLDSVDPVKVKEKFVKIVKEFFQ
jgi:hypothetical protein